MYGLDSSTRLDGLCGRTLVQIAFSMFQLILNLNNGDSFSIQGTCRVLSEDGKTLAEWRPEELCDFRDFAPFLNRDIIEYVVPGDGSIRLHFSNQKWLEILEDNEGFESYTISIGKRLIVV